VRRLFWFSAGIAAGVAVTRKVTATARKATPAGAAEQVGGALRELAGAVGTFGADVRVAMGERETELQDVVEQATQPRRRPRRPEAEALARPELAAEPGRARRAGR
jgi:hypothetical protein